ncbi:MAG: hypothetical protein ACKVQK_31005 [Burkholderiales bacterium]
MKAEGKALGSRANDKLFVRFQVGTGTIRRIGVLNPTMTSLASNFAAFNKSMKVKMQARGVLLARSSRARAPDSGTKSIIFLIYF